MRDEGRPNMRHTATGKTASQCSRSLLRSSPWRPEVGGSEAKNARAPRPRRDTKRLDSGRARLENVGVGFAKRKKLTRSMMSACCLGNKSVANAERGTNEVRPSSDRAIWSLFDEASATQPARATVGRCGGSIAKVVAIKDSDSARA
jgi:hypothetical protein